MYMYVYIYINHIYINFIYIYIYIYINYQKKSNSCGTVRELNAGIHSNFQNTAKYQKHI